MLSLCSDEALAQLQVFQREDFEGIFEAMDGLPVTIRLLDPPLHEFLPKEGTAALHDLIDKVTAPNNLGYRYLPRYLPSTAISWV